MSEKVLRMNNVSEDLINKEREAAKRDAIKLIQEGEDFILLIKTSKSEPGKNTLGIAARTAIAGNMNSITNFLEAIDQVKSQIIRESLKTLIEALGGE